MNNSYSNDQLTDLYQQTYSSVYAVAYSIVKNEQDACDLTQETYISAFTSLDKLNDIQKFDKWVIQIVANKCKDFLRKKKPDLFSQMGEEDQDFEADIIDTSHTYSPNVAVEDKESRTIISQLLDKLPEDQRLCLVLYYGHDMKISEIAATLGVSENTVKSRLTYGKKKMKEQIEELESKGTKLRGVAAFGILPFIKQLFASPAPVSAPATATSSVQQAISRASSAGLNAAKNATAATKLSTKIVAAVAATTVAAAGAAIALNSDWFSSGGDTATIPQASSKVDWFEKSDTEIDLFENAIIEFIGFDGNGEMQVTLKEENANEWDADIVFSVEDDGNLSNGDKITVIAQIENYAEKEFSVQDGYTLPETQEKKYTVQNLTVLLTKEEIKKNHLEALKEEAIACVGSGYYIYDVYAFYGEPTGEAEYSNVIFVSVNYTDKVLYIPRTDIYAFYNCYLTELDGAEQIKHESMATDVSGGHKDSEETALAYLKNLCPEYDISSFN